MDSARARALVGAGALLALCFIASIQLQEGFSAVEEDADGIVRESDSVYDALADIDEDDESQAFKEYNERRPDRDDSDDLSDEEKALMDAAADDDESQHGHHRSRHGHSDAQIVKWSQVAGVHDNPRNFKGFQDHRQYNEASVAKQMDEGESSSQDDLSREERELIAAANKHPRGKVSSRKNTKEATYMSRHKTALAEEDMRRTKADLSHQSKDEDDLSTEERDLLAKASGHKGHKDAKRVRKLLRKEAEKTQSHRKKAVEQAKHEDEDDKDDLTTEERQLIAAADHDSPKPRRLSHRAQSKKTAMIQAMPKAKKTAMPKGKGLAAVKQVNHKAEGLLTVNVDLDTANAEEFVEVEKKVPAKKAAAKLVKKFEQNVNKSTNEENDKMEKAMERITKAATKHAVQMQTKHLFGIAPAPVKIQVEDHKKTKKPVIRDRMRLNTQQTMILPSLSARQIVGAEAQLSPLAAARARRAAKASEIKSKFAEKLKSVKVVDTWAQRKAAADKAAVQSVRSHDPKTMRLTAEQLKNAQQLRQQLEAENPPAYMTPHAPPNYAAVFAPFGQRHP